MWFRVAMATLVFRYVSMMQQMAQCLCLSSSTTVAWGNDRSSYSNTSWPYLYCQIITQNKTTTKYYIVWKLRSVFLFYSLSLSLFQIRSKWKLLPKLWPARSKQNDDIELKLGEIRKEIPNLLGQFEVKVFNSDTSKHLLKQSACWGAISAPWGVSFLCHFCHLGHLCHLWLCPGLSLGLWHLGHKEDQRRNGI